MPYLNSDSLDEFNLENLLNQQSYKDFCTDNKTTHSDASNFNKYEPLGRNNTNKVDKFKQIRSGGYEMLIDENYLKNQNEIFNIDTIKQNDGLDITGLFDTGETNQTESPYKINKLIRVIDKANTNAYRDNKLKQIMSEDYEMDIDKICLEKQNELNVNDMLAINKAIDITNLCDNKSIINQANFPYTSEELISVTNKSNSKISENLDLPSLTDVCTKSNINSPKKIDNTSLNHQYFNQNCTNLIKVETVKWKSPFIKVCLLKIKAGSKNQEVKVGTETSLLSVKFNAPNKVEGSVENYELIEVVHFGNDYDFTTDLNSVKKIYENGIVKTTIEVKIPVHEIYQAKGDFTALNERLYNHLYERDYLNR